MIGMMYLVLTAMLALNVSKDAVEAFKNIDNSLTLTVKNYNLKNNDIYQQFEASFAEFPEKTGPYRDKALEVKLSADEIFEYLQGLKKEIVLKAEGEDTEAVQGDEVIIDHVEKIDDNNVPSEILIGANDDGKAFFLRTMLDEYRESLITTLAGENPTAEEAIRKSLSTDDYRDPKTQDKIKWPNHNFQALPLVYVITMLSKIQVDVRNAETEVINHLYAQIDKATFKFDQVSAVVIPKSTYIQLGGTYEASVFLSATDSRQLPAITIEGGRQLDYDDEGKGIYTVKPSRIGVARWGGVINLKAPDGTIKPYPFESEYSVGESNVIVSPTAVNIMYTGIPNPIDVSVPGVRPDKIRIRVTNGTYSTEKVRNRTGEVYKGNWQVTPTVEGGKIVQIIVTAEDAGGRPQTYPPYEFRVKNLPKPEPQFAGKNSGPVTLGILKASDQVFAVMRDFEFDLLYSVTEFTMGYLDRFGFVEKSTTGGRLTQEQRDIISRLTRGQTLQFTGIKARDPSGRIQDLGPIVLKVD